MTGDVLYRIGSLAKAAGVPTSTVRYYERRGLILPDVRSQAHHRLYGGGAVDKLRAIRAHQRSGLTLRDIRQIFDVAEGRSAPRKTVQRIVARRLEQVEDELRTLRQVRSLLHGFLEICEQARRRSSLEVTCPGVPCSRLRKRKNSA